jgi:HK97 family phage major capsid protein/HK97 family phage prohead protease
MTMNRAHAILTVKAIDEDKRLIEGVATTPTTDRMGDIVEPLGAKFALPLPLLWQHQADTPVGRVEFAKATKSGITFKAQIEKITEPGPLKDDVDRAWQAVKANLVRGVSIGFRSTERELIDEDAIDSGIRFTGWEWLELSLVTIPANAEATISNVKKFDSQYRDVDVDDAKGLDGSALPAATGTKKQNAGASDDPGVTGQKRKTTKPVSIRTQAMSKKTVAEQIAAFEASRQAKSAKMAEIMEKAGEENMTLDATQKEEYDTLAEEVKEIDDHLGRLAALEKATKVSAKPVDGTSAKAATEARQGSVRVEVRDQLPKGVRFARYAMCMAAGRGSQSDALSFAQRKYPNEEDLHLYIKGAVGAQHSDNADYGAALVPFQLYEGDFIDYLRPQTILGKFGQGGVPALRSVPFNVSIPRQVDGGAAYWAGEGIGKGLTQFQFDRVTLRFTKIANIAVLTDELVRFSSPNAEVLVRDQLAQALVHTLDADFIDPSNTGTVDVKPASITAGATTQASGGVQADDVREDVTWAMTQFINANIAPTSGVWIMEATTALNLSLMRNPLGQPEYPTISMTGGTFVGLPVIVSEHVPTGIVALVNASDIYLADDGSVRIDASREASLAMDSAPAMDVGTGSPSTPTAASVVSLWQTNSIGIRAERYVNWMRRRDAAVAYLTGVAWSATATP